jgi:hypothetical protein
VGCAIVLAANHHNTSTLLQSITQILNNASRDFVSELAKFKNIPALAQGAEIIQALDTIRTRPRQFQHTL